MGSLGSGTCLSLLLLTLPLLLLRLDGGRGQDSCSSQGGNVQISSRNVTANFDYKIERNPRFSPNTTEKLPRTWRLPNQSLNISTVLLRRGPPLLKCAPCIRIDISVNASGLPELRGFNVQGLEISRNRFHSFNILNINDSHVEDLWTVRFDCWKVAPEQVLHVTLSTIPSSDEPVTKLYYVAKRDPKPQFRYEHLAEEKRFVVSIPDGPDAYAHLCYRNNACDELPNSPQQLVTSSQNISLTYQHLLSCLCIEVFYAKRDSRRNQICPFQKQQELHAAELLEASIREIMYEYSQMTVRYKSLCPGEPQVAFCKHGNGTCVTVPEANITPVDKLPHLSLSTTSSISREYNLDGVDKDPHLCFKFTIMNESRITCPNDRAWDMDMNMQLFDVLLTIYSNVPASFSAIICQQNQSGDCSPQSDIYNVSTGTSYGKFKQMVHLSLPRPDIGSCIMFWRSDVRFAYKYLLCSFDYSHKHLGLVLIIASLLVFTLISLLFFSCQRLLKIFTAPLWRRTILLVYSSDSAEYRKLICIFADLLQSFLGCEVILDLWDMNTVSQIGMLPWFFQKRELVAQQKGKVMIVWSKRSKTMYEQWNNRELNGIVWRDSNNLFGAAMSCLQKDIYVKQEGELLEQYMMVYFEGLCEKKDIPKSLRKISRFRLFKDLYRLVSKLQDTTCLSPNCLIKAFAKYLIRKLLSSEKSQGLKHHIELCKQKLLEEVT